MEGQVLVGKPQLESKYRVRIPVVPSGVAKSYVRDDFVCEYDVPLDNVPEQILSLPAVANLVPFSWMLDCELTAEITDRAFLDCLPEIKDAYRCLFPSLNFAGAVRADTSVETSQETNPDASVTLYSGGTDSVSTALLHRDENLTISTIWGISTDLDNPAVWNVVRERAEAFAAKHGINASFVRSNVVEYLDEYELNRIFAGHLGNWRRGSSGMSLLTQMAPIAYHFNAATIYISACHTPDFGQSWGTHPKIDNHVRWGKVRCLHEGYDLSRLAKLRVISELAPDQPILVCDSGTSLSGNNCGRCEKCVRTTAELAAIGVNPANHGFQIDDTTWDRIRDAIETGQYKLDENRIFFWKDLQRHIAERPSEGIPGAEAFFAWLGTVDFDKLKWKPNRRAKLIKDLRGRIARPLPKPVRRLAREFYYKAFRDM